MQSYIPVRHRNPSPNEAGKRTAVLHNAVNTTEPKPGSMFRAHKKHTNHISYGQQTVVYTDRARAMSYAPVQQTITFGRLMLSLAIRGEHIVRILVET